VTRGVVHSIYETTPEVVARRLAATPGAVAWVEIRADALRAADVAGLVRRAAQPAIVTVRTEADGGSFDGSTAEKRAILESALAAGAAFVDVEWDGPMRELALGAAANRTILSHHGAPCEPEALGRLWSAMAETKSTRWKIVPRATRAAELPALRELLARARAERRALCAFASGAPGTWSRVMALLWGSWGTYGAAARGRESGEGQIETRLLQDVYRVMTLSETTTAYAIFGTPLGNSPSPSLHAAGYAALGLDAVYVPVDAGGLADVEAIVTGGGPPAIAGFGVTIPLKEPVAARCVELDAPAACGSANTVVVGPTGWAGFNTDAPAALSLIKKTIDPHEAKVAIAGSGGTARAIAAALVRAGATVTLYGRSSERTAAAALAAGAAAAPWAELAQASWDVLVQATPAGRNGEEILLRRHLNGRMVLDAAYGAESTPLVRAARARGLAVADGFDLLEAQAALQFERLTGRTAPREAMAAALLPYRDAAYA